MHIFAKETILLLTLRVFMLSMANQWSTPVGAKVKHLFFTRILEILHFVIR